MAQATAPSQSQNRGSAQPITASYLKVLTVEDYEGPGGKAARSWTQIGVAFPPKDGAGLNAEQRCLPLNGRLVIVPPDDDEGTNRGSRHWRGGLRAPRILSGFQQVALPCDRFKRR